MKKLQLLLVFIITLVSFQAVPGLSAQAADPSPKEYYQGLPLCLPGAYLQEPDRCLPMGPSGTMTSYARLGMTIPQQPFPVAALPPDLGPVPYQYLKASDSSVPIYSTLEDAMANNPRRTLAAGNKYLSYTQRVENNRGVFYQISTGEWIRGESVSSRVGYSTTSRGVLVTGVPRANFGWTIEAVETLTAPGVAGRPTGHTIPIYTLVYAYQTVQAEGYPWVMVAPNEWVEDRLVAKVIYNPTPPQGVTNGRWVEINLDEQTLSVYDQDRLVFAALAATGINSMATRPGLHQVTKKVPAENMTGAFEADRSDYYYLESVPWTVYFDEARAIHGIYWRTNFGRKASHGCVNLTIPDAHWLYDWIKEGDYVYAWETTAQ
jgi:lipoprotein-anchoring transpeptidase ErfK/SrfK